MIVAITTAATTENEDQVSQQMQGDYDVTVVGLGPVGLLAAVLLGRTGCSVAGLDKWPTPYPLPRAVNFDHEVARILHAVGINADADPAINFHDDHYVWMNAAGETLMDIDWRNVARDGWRNRYSFNQPALESRLRDLCASLPNVVLMPGNQVTGLTQDDDGVTVTFSETVVEGANAARKPDGRTGSLRARYLVGADGANSTVRQLLGLDFTDLDFYYDWLVVDAIPHKQMMYSPANYQICDPARPVTIVAGGPGKARGTPERRRWEFMALPGESLAELGSRERTWELLEPFGVTPQTADLERAVVWRFQAKYVDQWRVGRVALAGDAAHLMPPFAGEGMCAGLRDAANLCWRLDLVLRDVADPAILDDYTTERRDHVRWYIDFSVELGTVICVTDPEEAAERDAKMIAEHAIQAELGPISPHRAVLGPGAWVGEDPLAGAASIQGWVAYRGRTGRFDEVVGRGWVLVSAAGHGDALAPEQRELLQLIGGFEVTVGAAGSGADVIDSEGVYERWMQENSVQHLLVRPDYQVAATAADETALRSAFDQVAASLGLGAEVPR
jgi:resorcinol 4-hydroxylase (NADPH)